MAELADALDLGSSVSDVQVQVLSSAVKWKAYIQLSTFLLQFFITDTIVFSMSRGDFFYEKV